MISKQPARNVLLKQLVKSPARQDSAQEKGQRLVRIFYFPSPTSRNTQMISLRQEKFKILPVVMLLLGCDGSYF